MKIRQCISPDSSKDKAGTQQIQSADANADADADTDADVDVDCLVETSTSIILEMMMLDDGHSIGINQ